MTVHAGDRLSARGERDDGTGGPGKEMPAAWCETRGSVGLVVVMSSRSEVHVVPPCRESPRAMNLREQHRQPGQLRRRSSVGFANPPRSGSAFCDVAEATPCPSSVSRWQPRRYGGVARPADHPGTPVRTRAWRGNLRALPPALSDAIQMLGLAVGGR